MCVQMWPCWECSKALVAAGISRVLFECSTKDMESGAKWGRSRLAAVAAGMAWIPVPKDPERKAGSCRCFGLPSCGCQSCFVILLLSTL